MPTALSWNRNPGPLVQPPTKTLVQGFFFPNRTNCFIYPQTHQVHGTQPQAVSSFGFTIVPIARTNLIHTQSLPWPSPLPRGRSYVVPRRVPFPQTGCLVPCFNHKPLALALPAHEPRSGNQKRPTVSATLPPPPHPTPLPLTPLHPLLPLPPTFPPSPPPLPPPPFPPVPAPPLSFAPNLLPTGQSTLLDFALAFCATDPDLEKVPAGLSTESPPRRFIIPSRVFIQVPRRRTHSDVSPFRRPIPLVRKSPSCQFSSERIPS